ncbi:MAG: aldehyde ferredoxin oxidoreductase N-terminal domain-containing protein [Anaerolineae bacterium]
MAGGWAGKILDVDLTSGQIGWRDTHRYTRDYLGGRALASRIAWDELPDGIDAFDPENRIIITTGPLTGTLAPTSGRTVMSGLSPRLYPKTWYTHSTLGGWFGAEMKYAGFDGIVIRGRALRPVYLEIRDGNARLVDAGELWGMDARQTQIILKDRMGPQTQILAIGPAGENLVRFSTVQHAEDNAAGHSGFGAVWGSKNLKAITVRGTNGVAVAHPERLIREVLELGTYRIAPFSGALYTSLYTKTKTVREHRPVCSQACTFNCQVGNYGKASDGRRIPGHCVGGIAWMTPDFLKATHYSGGGVEIPPARNFGMCEEAELHELCNSLGLDSWFRLVMQPWFVRCQQLGVHQIRGYTFDPNDVSWFGQFMRDLAYRRGLGAIFADDLMRAMDELEGELPEELIALGRRLEFAFGFPAHREGRFWDEEPLPFWVISAMMYASETRDPTIGGHHSSLLLADFMLADREVSRRQFRILSEKVWGYPDALEPTFEHKAPVAIWSQHQHMLIDSFPLCDFSFPRIIVPPESREEWLAMDDLTGDLDIDLRLFAAVTGVELSRAEVFSIAERAFTLERLMLARAGRHRRMEEQWLAPHFMLPCRVDGTRIDPAGFSRILDEYLVARGWDLEYGWPKAETLKRLGLDDTIPMLEEYRRDRTRLIASASPLAIHLSS